MFINIIYKIYINENLNLEQSNVIFLNLNTCVLPNHVLKLSFSHKEYNYVCFVLNSSSKYVNIIAMLNLNRCPNHKQTVS